MTWTYYQRSGVLVGPGGHEFRGYSGSLVHRNDPTAEHIRNSGPIPRGSWIINLHPTSRRGPLTLELQPLGHSARGRSGFLIHGDNHEGDASTGCIVMPREAREAIINSGDSALEVRE